MSDELQLEQPFPRSLSGAPVESLPSARIPARAPIRGRYVELVPQDASRHAADLYAAGHESEEALRIWDYLAYGPWASQQDYLATMRAQSATFDTIFYALRPLDADRFEGIFYNHMIFRGRNRDTAWYSILDDEWPEVRGILEAWLDETNFDAGAIARTSLYEQMQIRSPSQRSPSQRGQQP